MGNNDWRLVQLLDAIEDAEIKLLRVRRSKNLFWLAAVAMWSTVIVTAVAGWLVAAGWFIGTVVLGVIFAPVTAVTGSYAYENLHKAQDELRTAQRAHRDHLTGGGPGGG